MQDSIKKIWNKFNAFKILSNVNDADMISRQFKIFEIFKAKKQSNIELIIMNIAEKLRKYIRRLEKFQI
jgi:hypothetical protein